MIRVGRTKLQIKSFVKILTGKRKYAEHLIHQYSM